MQINMLIVDSTLCRSDGLLWLHTTLIHVDDDTCEFCQNISCLSAMAGPFEAKTGQLK